MKKLYKGIIFNDDIKRILNGINAFDYKYDVIPDDSVIDTIRTDFKQQTNKIFNNKVTIISEDEMMEVNNLINWSYPHCYI